MAKMPASSNQILLPFFPHNNHEKGHTPGHIDCPVCEGTRGMYMGSISKEMTVSEAVDFYLNWRETPVVPGITAPQKARFIGRRTLKDYRQKTKALLKFFGEMRLGAIHVGNFNEYQMARLTANGYTRSYGKRVVPSPAGVIKINSELAVLKRLMKMGGCWTPELEMYYQPFQEIEPESHRALDLDEQERFLTKAAEDPRWHPVWWYALVSLHLQFSSDEMRTIRLGDINLAYQTVSVNPGFGKNSFRRRTNTVEDGACLWALQRLMERAGQLGRTAKKYNGPQPHYFLFPRRLVKNLYDPELPMCETGLRKLFDEVRVAAGVPWFPFNGFRHTGLTRLAELGVEPYIMEKRAGHIGAKMMRKYVQISQQAQRLSIRNALQKKPPESFREMQVQQRMQGY